MKKKRKKKIRPLHNRLSKEDAMAILEKEDFNRITVSFYKYVNIKDPTKLRDDLYTKWSELGCLGRIYLAIEGINAQMNVPEHNWDVFVEHLYSLPEFTDVPFKIGVEQGDSFWKLNVRTKRQIVADGLDHGDYDIENVGKHLNAEEFNTAMQDPETVVVDMRNHYESEIGHFEGALCHPVDTFREQLPLVVNDIAEAKDKKVLLYCTGGIRCEKASAYLKHKGFKDVNQLHGGVIAYAHQVREKGLDSRFHGSNYVFDGRNKENINGEIISHCHQCGELSDRHVNCQNRSCNLLFLQCEGCEEKMDMTCSSQCKKVHNMPPERKKAYYKKHGFTDQQKFSKSLQAREKFAKKSPWQKVLSLFK